MPARTWASAWFVAICGLGASSTAVQYKKQKGAWNRNTVAVRTGKLVQPVCRLRHSTQIHTRWRSEQRGEDTGRNDSGAIAKIGSGRGCILGGRGTRRRASCRGGRRRRGGAGSSGARGRRRGGVATAGLELSRVQSAAVVLDVGDASVLACLVSNVLEIAVGESLLADEL